MFHCGPCEYGLFIRYILRTATALLTFPNVPEGWDGAVAHAAASHLEEFDRLARAGTPLPKIGGTELCGCRAGIVKAAKFLQQYTITGEPVERRTFIGSRPALLGGHKDVEFTQGGEETCGWWHGCVLNR